MSRLARFAALALMLAGMPCGHAAEPGDPSAGVDPAADLPDAAQPSLPFPADPHFHSSGTWGQTHGDQWAVQALGIYRPGEPPQELATILPIIVAVIDTGIDLTHPDLDPASLWRNPDEQNNGVDDDGNGYVDDLLGWNFVDRNNLPWDHSGHGTHITGIIAAATNNNTGVAGIAPMARVMPLKVGSFAGRAASPAIAAAIHYAVDHGARIINLSLGGKQVSRAERDAISYAVNHQVLVVVAAGNQATNVGEFGYGALSGVITVAASDQTGARAAFSNHGTQITLTAPGVDILSLRARNTDFIQQSGVEGYVPGGAVVADHYYRATGTSFAAAVVSGVAARLLAARPTLTGDQLRRVLTQSAEDIAAPGFDRATGFGLVSFTRALSQDPDSYIIARLDHIAMRYRDEAAWVEVYGAAQAADLSEANLSVVTDAGTTVLAGTSVPDRTLPADEDAGLLAAINFDDLAKAGPRPWRLRLTVADGRGGSRSADMNVSLPPAAPLPEVVDE